jgi:hypothetical protein
LVFSSAAFLLKLKNTIYAPRKRPSAKILVSVHDPTKGIKIDAGVDAYLLEKIHGVLCGNVAGCSRDKWTAAQASGSYVEDLHTGFVSDHPIRQTKPPRIVKMQ